MSKTDPPIHCAHDAVVSLKELIPTPENPNSHPPEQIMVLGKIIREQGWRRPIRVSNLSGRIVAGHGAFEAARAEGFTVAPVDYQDYGSEQLEWADLLADNQIPELAEIEDEKLAMILRDLRAANDLAPDDERFDLTLTGFSDDQIVDLIETLENVDEGGEPKLKEPKPLDGDLFELIGRATGKSADDLADFSLRIHGTQPRTWKLDLAKKVIVLKK